MLAALKKMKLRDDMPQWMRDAYAALGGENDDEKLGELFEKLSIGEQDRSSGQLSKADTVRGLFLCSATQLHEQNAVEIILRATIDACVPVEQIGSDKRWPLQ